MMRMDLKEVDDRLNNVVEMLIGVRNSVRSIMGGMDRQDGRVAENGRPVFRRDMTDSQYGRMRGIDIQDQGERLFHSHVGRYGERDRHGPDIEDCKTMEHGRKVGRYVERFDKINRKCTNSYERAEDSLSDIKKKCRNRIGRLTQGWDDRDNRHTDNQDRSGERLDHSDRRTLERPGIYDYSGTDNLDRKVSGGIRNKKGAQYCARKEPQTERVDNKRGSRLNNQTDRFDNERGSGLKNQRDNGNGMNGEVNWDIRTGRYEPNNMDVTLMEKRDLHDKADMNTPGIDRQGIDRQEDGRLRGMNRRGKSIYPDVYGYDQKRFDTRDDDIDEGTQRTKTFNQNITSLSEKTRGIDPDSSGDDKKEHVDCLRLWVKDLIRESQVREAKYQNGEGGRFDPPDYSEVKDEGHPDCLRLWVKDLIRESQIREAKGDEKGKLYRPTSPSRNIVDSHGMQKSEMMNNLDVSDNVPTESRRARFSSRFSSTKKITPDRIEETDGPSYRRLGQLDELDLESRVQLVENFKSDLSEQVDMLCEMLESTIKEKDEHAQQLCDNNEQLDFLKAQLDEATKEVKHLSEQKNGLIKKNSTLTTEMEKMSIEATRELEEQDEELCRLKRQLDTSNNKLEKTLDDLDEANRKLTDCDKQLRCTQAELGASQETNCQLDLKFESYRRAHRYSNEEVHEKDEDLRNLSLCLEEAERENVTIKKKLADLSRV